MAASLQAILPQPGTPYQPTQGQGPQVAQPASNVSAQDRDTLIRTVIGEAGNESPHSQAAVAWTVRNRQASGFAPTINDVALQKGQFEPWMTRSNELRSIDPNSAEYKKAAAVVDDVLSGRVPDPTGGATHFYAPVAQAQLGRRPPDWASQFASRGQVGGHLYFADPAHPVPDSGLKPIQDRLGPQGEVPAANPLQAPQQGRTPVYHIPGQPDEQMKNVWLTDRQAWGAIASRAMQPAEIASRQVWSSRSGKGEHCGGSRARESRARQSWCWNEDNL
jgi:hypothetical protein